MSIIKIITQYVYQQYCKPDTRTSDFDRTTKLVRIYRFEHNYVASSCRTSVDRVAAAVLRLHEPVQYQHCTIETQRTQGRLFPPISRRQPRAWRCKHYRVSRYRSRVVKHVSIKFYIKNSVIRTFSCNYRI